MKKILTLLFIYIFFHAPCFAAITREEAMSQTYLENHGHSAETVRLINLQNAQINGVQTVYKSKDPDWYTTNKPIKFLRQVFIYFDPGLDDDKFGSKNDIQFTDNWHEL